MKKDKLSKEEKAELKRQKQEETRRQKEMKKAEKQRPEIQDGKIKYLFRLIVLIVFLALAGLGFYYVTHYEDSAKIIKNMDDYKAELDSKTANATKAQAYAESFVADYYTHDTKNLDDYSKRVTSYLAKGLSLEAPTTNDSAVLSAEAESIEPSEDGYDVTVRMVVRWTVPLSEEELKEQQGASESRRQAEAERQQAEAEATNEDEDGESNYNDVIAAEESTSYETEEELPTTKEILGQHLVKVPVMVDDDGNCAVVSLPLYIADGNTASSVGRVEDLSDNADDKLRNDIQNLAENFLKAYCGDDKTQLKYLVTSTFPLNTLGEGYDFSSMDQCLIASGNNGKTYADVTYTVDYNGLKQRQRVFLTIVREDKYYVDKITTR